MLGAVQKVLKIKISKILRKPLIYHTIFQAKKVKKFTKIVCSSDSKTILKIAKRNKVDYVLPRPGSLSNHKVEKLKVIKHCLINSEKYFKIKFDYIVDLDVTAPLRSNNDIKKIINLISKKRDVDNILCLTPVGKILILTWWKLKKNKLEIAKTTSKNFHSRQKAPKVYEINAGLYA